MLYLCAHQVALPSEPTRTAAPPLTLGAATVLGLLKSRRWTHPPRPWGQWQPYRPMNCLLDHSSLFLKKEHICSQVTLWLILQNLRSPIGCLDFILCLSSLSWQGFCSYKFSKVLLASNAIYGGPSLQTRGSSEHLS